MRIIDTAYLDMLAHSTSADTVNILTDAIAVAELEEVDVGVQYSDNPFDFGSASEHALTGSQLDGNTDKGWIYGAFSGNIV